MILKQNNYAESIINISYSNISKVLHVGSGRELILPIGLFQFQHYI